MDEAVAQRVLVFGGLPPAGRDLDLLARPPEREQLATLLEREGFLRRGDVWARFRDCGVDVVELVAAEEWRLPPSELEALYADARPLAGMQKLVEPAPHHALLVLARKLARSREPLDEKRRNRVARALEEDSGAWARAADRAELWDAAASLRRLRRSYERAGHLGGAGLAFRVARALLRMRRGRIVAISGLDGSGKSSHAAALGETLQALGFDAVSHWTPLGTSRVLELGAAAARTALRSVGRLPKGQPWSRPSLIARPGGSAKRGLADVWATMLAFENGLSHLARALPDLLHGRIVIFDRYVLDSAVRLRFLYGEHRSFGFQRRLIRLLSPKPRHSYWLDVSPETVLARKELQFDLDELRRQARLYGEEHLKLDVTRIDGERPREDVCAEIAAEVWLSLRG